MCLLRAEERDVAESALALAELRCKFGGTENIFTSAVSVSAVNVWLLTFPSDLPPVYSVKNIFYILHIVKKCLTHCV